MKRQSLILGCIALAMLVGTAAAQPKVYQWNGALPIPDNNPAGVGQIITVPDQGIVDDLDVDMILPHTWQGDIIVTLTSPGGISATLVNRPGTSGTGFGFSADNYGNPATGDAFILDDEAAAVYDLPVAQIPNVSGNWLPDLGPLSLFDGTNKFGDWTLNVSDNAGGDTGELIQWSLHFVNVPEPTTLSLLGVSLAAMCVLRRRVS